MATTAAEHAKTRSDLVQLAGRGPISFISVLAGVLVGYATFGLLLGGAVVILRGNDSQFDLSESWDTLTPRGGLLLGGLLLASYLLAGYMAGRMAWRRGMAHGLVVFFSSIFVVAVAAALIRSLTQPEDVEGITDALRTFGIPTTLDEWSNVGGVVWICSLGGMAVGSILGGLMGERWFTKVSRRALKAEVDVRDRMTATNGPAREDTGAATTETPVRNGNGNGHRNGNGKAARPAPAEDMDELTREELYHRAQEQEIPGRSHMTKDELKEALQNQR